MEPLPSLDVVVATLGRRDELAALLASLARQSPVPQQVIVVDQNSDERVAEVLAAAPPGLETVHLRSPAGLSRARNVGLERVTAELVSFPDDDSAYPDGLLERVAARFLSNPELGALTGRTTSPSGHASGRWPSVAGVITLDTVWHGGNSASTFVRSSALARVGPFDERLGLGSGTPWASGEDTDLLLRLLRGGTAISYDPTVVVHHPVRSLTADERVAVGARNGASVGFLLRKHGYGGRTVVRMLVRPAVGVPVALVSGELTEARVRLATLRGRIRGYRAGAW